MTQRLLALGLGYSATALAARLSAKGWRVAGTARGADSLARIASRGFEAIPYDGAAPSDDLAQAIAEATHLVVSIAPNEVGDPALRHHREHIAAAPHLRWIGYLSTVGVYGDHGGAWVDEQTPPNPSPGRSMERVAAEHAWGDVGVERGARTQIFRLSGIYGPGRNPLERMLAGDKQTIYKPGQVFNRIHVEDIATVLEAAIAGASDQPVFNVTDDEPAPPQEVADFAAALLGIAPPPLVPLDEAILSPMARSFYAENKRVRNELIKTELGVALAYPTYREGLRAIYDDLRARGRI
ncbi:MAG: SDR family oxidoreductase [Hyphomicrobiales bacterium]|nr:SDR family oxidoreductase [Hyphomicrobiales bacterium]